MTTEPRRPGQSNGNHDARTKAAHDANAQFLGTHSLQGGGSYDALHRLNRAVARWWDRRRARRRPPG